MDAEEKSAVEGRSTAASSQGQPAVSKVRRWLVRRRLRAALVHIMKRIGAYDRSVWITVFELPKREPLSDDLDPSHIRGLLHVSLVAAEESDHLIMLWRDHVARRAAEGRDHRPSTATLAWEGPISVARPRKDPWWKPTSLFDGIIKIAAVIGGLTVLAAAGARFLTVPQIRLRPPEPEAANAVLGRQLEVDVGVFNERFSTATAVSMIATSDSSTPEVVPSEAFVVGPGETSTISVRSNFNSTGIHTIRLQGTAEAGLRMQKIDQSIRVRVWPEHELVFNGTKLSASGRLCSLRGRFRAGTAHGQTHCEAIFSVPGVELRTVRGMGVEEQESVSLPEGVNHLTWTMRAVEAFGEVPLELVFQDPEGDRLSAAICQQIGSTADTAGGKGLSVQCFHI